MKQESFLFVDIISSIFLLILLIGNFFGLMYITDANFGVSLIISLLVVVFYYFILQLLKRNKERMANKGYKDPAMFFFFVYFVFGVGSFIIMSHLVNIEDNVKPQIQAEANRVVSEAKKASDAYYNLASDALQTFESNFKRKLQEYKISRSNILWDELSNQPYNLPESILKSPSNTIDIVESSNAILQSYQSKIEVNKKNIDSLQIQLVVHTTAPILYWDRLNIMKSYRAMNQRLKETEDYINARIKELPVKKESIVLASQSESIPLDNPFQLAQIYAPNYIVPAVIVMIMHLFILIPFFTHKIRIYQKVSDELDSKTHKGAIEL
jgi:amino acid transporter